MLYVLKNCRDGADAVYNTAVDITERDGVLTFRFDAEHSQYYCCGEKYNDIHSAGDACEVLIGSDSERRVYYEIEISPAGELMLARITYLGEDSSGTPIIDVDLIDDCFLDGGAEHTEKGYTAFVRFKKNDILTGDGEVFFNAYRLETDGGEMEKHLFALVPTLRPKFHVPSFFALLRDYI